MIKKKLTSKQVSATNHGEELPNEKTPKQSQWHSEDRRKLVTGVCISSLTPEERAATIALVKEEVEGRKQLPADDISSLTPEEKAARIENAREAVFRYLLKNARSLADANPSAFTKLQ